MTTAWQQLLEEAKELVSHTECEVATFVPYATYAMPPHTVKNNHRKHGLSLPDGESQRTDHYELSPRNTLKTEDCETEYRPAND